MRKFLSFPIWLEPLSNPGKLNTTKQKNKTSLPKEATPTRTFICPA